MIKYLFSIFLSILFFCSAAYPQTAEERGEMRYQLHLYDEMSEYLNDVFSKFNSGFLTPDEAFEKVMLIRHEYGNLTENIPPEAEKLKIAVNALLSRIENYFIHYNYAFREDPELNLKLARARYELAQEVERLRFKYLY